MKHLNEENIKYLNSPITILKGIGPKKALLFNRLGIYTVLDLLYYLPRKYEDRRTIKKISQCSSGEVCCIKIIPARQIIEKRIKSKLSLFLLYGTDGEECITIKWFSAPFAKPKIKSRTEYIVFGKMLNTKSGKEFELRCIEPADDMNNTGAIIPLYPTTSGLTSKTIADAVKTAYLSNPVLLECIPDNIVSEFKLPEINSAIRNMHNPTDFISLETSRRRLAFEELFVLQLALFNLKRMRKDKIANVINTTEKIREFASFLPFQLTDGQKML